MTNEPNPKKIFSRLLGALIIYRTVAPVIIIIMLGFILYYIPTEINRISSEAVQRIEDEHMAPLKDSLAEMQKEVARLKGEVRKAKRVVEGVQSDLKTVVSPIYAAISALTVALKQLRNFSQMVVNSIIHAVNVLPAVNIPRFEFPEINIDLPQLNLDVLKINLSPDLSGLKEIQRISKEVGAEVAGSAKKAGETFSFGWTWIKVIIVLFVIWLLSLLITIFEGMRRSIYRGWQMLSDGEVKAPA